jgi:hypothetical protein
VIRLGLGDKDSWYSLSYSAAKNTGNGLTDPRRKKIESKCDKSMGKLSESARASLNYNFKILCFLKAWWPKSV